VQTDPRRWVSQDSQTIKNITQVQDRVGASSELGIFITSTDLFSDTTARFVDDFAARQLAAHPRELVGAASLVTVVSYLADVPGATHVAPTGAEVAAAYAVEPPDLKQSTVNSGGHAFNLIFRVSPISLEQLKGVVNDVRATTAAPAGVSATPSGLAVVGVGLLNNIESNRVALTYYALAVIGILVLAFSSMPLLSALIVLPPLLVAADHSGWVHRRGEPAPDSGWSRGLGPSASAGPSGSGAAESARTGGRRKRRDGR